ncbi:MAG: hypothetical protein U5L04_01380 [Trueperaceae bacterium]|nr:hypothetical protein [Trueperaceae bacterium]
MMRAIAQSLFVLFGCVGLLVGSAYAIDLTAQISDVALSGLLQILAGMITVVLVPLVVATVAYLSGLLERGRSALLLGLATAASSVGGIALAFSAYPLPWDDTVPTPGWVWEKLDATQEAWVNQHEEAFWNVLEPPLPAPDRMWARPDTSVAKDRLNDPDFVWTSRIYIGYPLGFIRTVVALPSETAPVLPRFASVRAPPERYLTTRQRGNTLELTVSVAPRWLFTPDQTRAQLDTADGSHDAVDVRRDDTGMIFVFRDVTAASAAQFVVLARAGENRLLLRFQDVFFDALASAEPE